MAGDVPPISTGTKSFGNITNNQGVVIGEASGSASIIGSQVINHYYTGPPESPPIPCCAIPFRRDVHFVERGTLLDQIHNRCSVPAGRAALVGLGGVGKSQLAIEYCHRVAEKSPNKWVFWVYAASTARLEQSYRDIANLVKIRDRDDQQKDIIKLVHDWLCNARNGEWLLVLDNADDATVLFNPPTNCQDLPQSKHGSILITTRFKALAVQLVDETLGEIISINPMEEVEGVKLLNSKLEQPASDDDAAALVASLEGMPLAITQAAAYIRTLTPQCSVQQYLKLFRKTNQGEGSLLDYEAGHLRRDKEASNSIIITWQVSFDYLAKTSRSAAALLALMSFFDPQQIPKPLLKDYTLFEWADTSATRKLEPWPFGLPEVPYPDPSLEHDLVTLEEFSFASVNANGVTFKMHALVQLSTRRWLSQNNHEEEFYRRFIGNLHDNFPKKLDRKTLTWASTMLLHVKSAELFQSESEGSQRALGGVLYGAAKFAHRTMKYDEAIRMGEKALRIRKRWFVSLPFTGRGLNVMTLLGRTYSDVGQSKKAIEMLEQVQKHSDGDDIAMSLLAYEYLAQHRLDKAESLWDQVLRHRQSFRKPQLPDIHDSMADLALLDLGHQDPSRRSDALSRLENALRCHKTFKYLNNAPVRHSMGRLGFAYLMQKKWDKAERLFEELRTLQCESIGPDHPHTVMSLKSLVFAMCNQGTPEKYRAAESMSRTVISCIERSLGAEHYSIFPAMIQVGVVLKLQENYEEAEVMLRRALEGCEKVLGSEHNSTLVGMAHLAETLQYQKKSREAEQMKNRAQEGYENADKLHGRDHKEAYQDGASYLRIYHQCADGNSW